MGRGICRRCICARLGVITEEMEFVATREKMEPETGAQRSGARPRDHSGEHSSPTLEPMGIGIAFKCKINANIGNSATTSEIDEELKKLHHAVHYGADTVMDLSTGGDIPDDSQGDHRCVAGADRHRADL